MPTQANRGLEWTSRRPKPGSIVKHCTLEYTGTRRYPMVPLRMVGAYMRRVWLGLFVCVLVAALVLFDRIMGSTPIVAERATDLNNLQQKQVDIFLQVTSLLAGFATLSLGGIGALIWDRKKLGKRPTPQLLTAASGCALSLYFGYLSYRYLLWMLGHRFFDLTTTFVTATGYLQFCAFFAAVIALADFIFVVD